MSLKTPGRVSAIKSQFENLTNFDAALERKEPRNGKPHLPKKFNFQRSATSVDLLKKPEKPPKIVNTWAGREISRKSADSVLQRNIIPQLDLNLSVKKSSELNQSQGNFSRHTADPVKRSSIRRSPAFRVGDKQNKTLLVKQNSLEPKEFDDSKFENFLVQKCGKDFDRLQQAGLTDSLKAALRQPLPTGPPPKKPPRTFGAPAIPEKPCQEIRSKIDFLENRLVLNKQSPQSPSNILQKSKTEIVLHHSSKLLDCLSCHKNVSSVYDSMPSAIESDERTPLMQANTNVIKRFSNSVKPAPEPIYMEPFSHLRSKSNENKCEKIDEEIGENQEMDTSPSSKMDCSTGSSNLSKDESNGGCCSCPGSHAKGDIHYLCTPIDDSLEDTSESSITDREGNLSLEKTYDEITILVDAAFKQRIKSKKDSNCNTMTNRSSDGSEGKGSCKLSRTLTERRKDYVRRIAVLPDKQSYGTLHRTFKSPVLKTFSLEEKSSSGEDEPEDDIKLESFESEQQISTSDRIDKYKRLIEGSTTTPASSIKLRPKKHTSTPKDLSSEDETEEENCPKLFQVCLLVGYNSNTNSAYLKSKYPPHEPIPDNIEQLIFPSSALVRSGRDNQEYCLILTDDNGFKIYGYCRRVIPENSDICLPLCYCIISVTKALGFYQKLLKEIESRHGQSESQMNFLFRNLQKAEIPSPGKYLHVKIPLFIRPKTLFSSNHKISPKRLSLEANPKWLAEAANTQENHHQEVENRKKVNQKSLVQEFEEKKSQQPFDLGLINRSLIMRDPRFDEILIRRPSDLRLENTELSELLICMGPELLINVFASLLLERKVILQSKNISLLSKSVLALQTILYPFQWQYTIVTILPASLIEICQAPFPVLAGILEDIPFDIEDGIVVDLTTKRIIQTCGDEQTIIPDSLRGSLQLSLEMVDLIDQGKMLSSVLISEGFLRFFIEVLGDYRKDYFNKDEFIHMHSSQNIRFFLEWFIETSMFRHFVNDRFGSQQKADDFYDLFNARIIEKSESSSKTIESIETIVKNSKIINKKTRTFKERFKQFFE